MPGMMTSSQFELKHDAIKRIRMMFPLFIWIGSLTRLYFYQLILFDWFRIAR